MIRFLKLKQSFKNPSRQFSVNLAFTDFTPIPSVSVIRTREDAREVVRILEAHSDRYHAWDTETIGIEVKEQSPVGNGKIICMSCFAGPDLDFGNGPR